MAEKKTKKSAGTGAGRKKAAEPSDADRLGRGLREAVGEGFEIFAPAVKHLLMAEKEVLLAVRAVLDKAIEKTDELANRQAKKGKRAKKVKIEVD